MIWLYGLFFAAAVAKWADVQFLQNIGWAWILVPLALLVLWFEVFERLLGFDRRRTLEDAQFEKAKKERIRKQLQKPLRR